MNSIGISIQCTAKHKIDQMKIASKAFKLILGKKSSNMVPDRSIKGSPTSKLFFNAVDKAHEILETERDLVKKVPSCVVVGMQSVGKSAVLSRISGISFPQDSEVCTRVAIELRLRRNQSQDDQDETKEMKIMPGDLDVIKVDKSDQKAVQSALRDAQQKVLAGRKFEDKISVKVEKEDEDVPEVTLIDLPGVFFAKDGGSDDLEEQVKNMINERVHNDMALILHVVPLNQDTDTISTWRTVRDADKDQKRTVSILTKADLASKDGRDNLKRRIQKILEDSKSSECFIVHGSAKDSEEEESQLAAVVSCIEELRLGARVRVGINELNFFIEERMLRHIRERLPEMRRLLEDELRLCTDELEKLGRHPTSPITIAFRDAGNITKELKQLILDFQAQYRKLTEDMAEEIFQIDMEPLGLIDASTARKDLEKASGNPLSARHHQIYLLALEVRKIGEDSRGLINVPFVGKSKELKQWMGSFADSLKQILRKHVENLFYAFQHKIFQPALEKGSSESTFIIRNRLYVMITKDVIEKARSSTIEYANFLVESVRENAYTTNTHYLTNTAKTLEYHIQQDFKSISNKADMQPHFDNYCGILAFFKTRKQMLSDTIQLHFTKILSDLCQETEKQIGERMVDQENLD